MRVYPAILLIGSLFAGSFLFAQTAATPKREKFQNADVIYDWVKDNHGDRLRTFITRPHTAQGKVPVIFFVGWLSCDSVEYPAGESDGFGAIFRRLIEQSGYATVRLDKPGVSESQGNCAQTDFQTELSGYQAAFDSLEKYEFIDLNKIFVIGLSNGGGTSVLVPRRHPVRGYIAASSWGRTWYEHMIEHERVRLTRAGKIPPTEINNSVKAFSDFYSLYLIHGMTPGEAIQQHPEWKTLWYDEPGGQYGRPAAFYQQLQALNLGAAWQNVNVPVLVIRGADDPIMSHNDSFVIAETVNHQNPSQARYVEIKGADHLLTVQKKLEDSVVPLMVEWMREHQK
ncbi:MAG TPA: alpha/beta hydrolase [Candidatus Angelobacter sp.]